MILQLIVLLLSLGGYALEIPLSPQAQQANPSLSPNYNPTTNPYGFTNQLSQQAIPQFNTGVTVYTVIAVVMALFIIILSLVLLVRYHNMETAFVGDGKRITGRIRCFIWGIGWADFRATQVPADEIEERLEIIKEIEEIKNKPNLLETVDSIIKKVKEGILHLYEIKVISRRNMRLRGNLGYSILISSEAIDNSKFFYESRNAVLSPFSGTWREHPRILHCLAQSKVYTDVEMADRNRTTTVYVIAPVAGDFAVNKNQTFGQNLEEFGIHPVSINVNLFDKPRDMGEVLAIARTVADTYKIGAVKQKQADTLQNIVQKMAGDKFEMRTEADLWMSKAGENPLVVLGEKIYQRMTQESWIWLMAAIFLGFIGIEMPKWVPAWNSWDPAMTYAIMAGFVIMMKYALQKKETPEEKFRQQRTEVQMGSGEAKVLQP